MWFTDDLRLDDNLALNEAAQADELLCVYVVERAWFEPRRYQYPQMGPHRWGFIQQSLSELNQRLLVHNQRLLVVYGSAIEEISRLIERYRLNKVVATRRAGTDEQLQWAALTERYPDVDWQLVDNRTLFKRDDMNQLTKMWPMSFSAFRRQVEPWPVRDPVAQVTLPPSVTEQISDLNRPAWLPQPRGNRSMFDGGETEALGHLERYFASNYPKTYKQDRNAIDDWDSSAKTSPWLNSGCLSPRRFKAMLASYDRTEGSSEGTHWLFVELLWREYFQWLAHNMGSRLFHFQGLAPHRPLTSFYADRFRQWREGNTPWPIVNACMRQLKQTGFLSNRGRQIAASALVNELALDWRYGAAWFEYCLVDYDVASNWGNWQYIAGVGTDSRGGRHFNLEKQTELFDPDGAFSERWAAEAQPQPINTLDPTGWPIGWS